VRHCKADSTAAIRVTSSSYRDASSLIAGYRSPRLRHAVTFVDPFKEIASEMFRALRLRRAPARRRDD
jgi:hypothetical protein